MNSKQPSGAQKRRKMKEREENRKKQQNALSVFFQKRSNHRDPVRPDETDADIPKTLEPTAYSIEEPIHEENDGSNYIVAETVPDLQVRQEEHEKSADICPSVPADIALWPKVITSAMQHQFLVDKPLSIYGTSDSSKITLLEGNKLVTRSLTDKAFYLRKENGETVKREWLVYSSTSGCVYCYVCRLFSNRKNPITEWCKNWKNIHKTLTEHENSKEHTLAQGAMVSRSSVVGRIDSNLEIQLGGERKYWREILKRIAATVKFLAKQGLAFRGSNETVFSAGSGNYLGALEFLSEFDPLLAKHLATHANKGKGSVSYLSSTTCDEFIAIMHNCLKDELIAEVKKSKYFSIIVDSTPDVSHVDQLTIVMRYMLPSGDPIERFFAFVPIVSHTGQSLETTLVKVFTEMGIDISNCRGQSYDNAANMSGKYNGLQAKIKSHSSTADFIPCSSHSLNLVGNAAAECNLDVIKYFDLIENIYVFLSTSTHRWNVLETYFKKTQSSHLTVKKMSQTRWSARADAVRALKIGHSEIQKTLIELSQDISQKPIAQIEAKKLGAELDSLEFALLTVVRDKILNRLNATSKSLQDPNIFLKIAATLFESLVEFLKGIRSNFDEMKQEALKTSKTKNYRDELGENRIKYRKKAFDESATSEVVLTGKRRFLATVFYPICDKLICELTNRARAYLLINDRFEVFFLDINGLTIADVSRVTKDLKIFYRNDIKPDNFDEEVYQFLILAHKNGSKSLGDMYKFIINQVGLISTFPNVEIILRIYLILPSSNATGERSFSVLKRVKNYLRSRMSQDKLNAFALMCIEHEVLCRVDCDSVITKFADKKARKAVI